MQILIRLLLALALSVPVLTTGCATGTAQHPGSVNAFDSQSYDALLSIQAGIEQAKTQFANMPAAKDTLNKIIASYNIAMKAWKTYHAAASPAPSAQQDLQNQITALKASLASLTATFKGTP